MIRSIVKDEKFLAKKCKPATKKDLAIGQDLLDTLRANQSVCIGMAANMIGQQKKHHCCTYGFDKSCDV